MRQPIFFMIFSMVFLLSCQKHQSSLEKRGEKLITSLAKELERIETAEELKKSGLKLKKKMDQVSELLIEAMKSDKGPSYAKASKIANDRLLYELYRLSKNEECQNILIELQRDALEKVDWQHSKLKKSK